MKKQQFNTMMKQDLAEWLRGKSCDRVKQWMVIDDLLRPIMEKEEQKKAPPQSSVPAVTGDVELIFQFWVETMAKRGAKLTPKRRRNVQSRLADGYTVEQIKTAIVGCSSSKYHMGENTSGTIYNDLELICRTGEKLEQFMGNVGAGSRARDQDADDWADGGGFSGEVYEHA